MFAYQKTNAYLYSIKLIKHKKSGRDDNKDTNLMKTFNQLPENFKVTNGTREAFLTMISERGVSNKLGIDRSVVSNWNRAMVGKVKDRSIPTLDKMEEMLLKYGAVVKQDKIWEL